MPKSRRTAAVTTTTRAPRATVKAPEGERDYLIAFGSKMPLSVVRRLKNYVESMDGSVTISGTMAAAVNAYLDRQERRPTSPPGVAARARGVKRIAGPSRAQYAKSKPGAR